MKKIFLLIALPLMTYMAQAQTTTTTADNPNAPEITFTEETHDFGKQQEGPKISYDFTFKNTGKEPLILSNVKASCGCTVPTWPKEPVMPGQSATITVTYTTQGHPGPFTKSVTVTSNAKTASKVIYIKGEVLKVSEAESMPINTGSMLSPH